MPKPYARVMIRLLLILLTLLIVCGWVARAQAAQTVQPRAAAPASVGAPGSWSDWSLQVGPGGGSEAPETAMALRVAIGLALISLLPALLVSVTSFLRIIIVLSMLRHAFGMQETPPNSALIGLALFLTLFTMSPILERVNQDAVQPFLAGKASMETAFGAAVTPLRDFMVRQTREQDLALMVELAKKPPPQSMDDIGNLQLIPAFMLSELRMAFQIGFVIFLPFLLIDLVVSSILMALGMMMMPPVTISLPIKILMFVLIDGWGLVLRSTVGSLH